MKKKLFICLLLFALLLSLPSAVQASTDGSPFDMSDAVCYEPYSLTPSALLAEILGEEISDAEASYLDSASNFHFYLHDAIPADRVTTSPSQEGLTVRALPYRYTAANGCEIVWVPHEAILGPYRVAFSQTSDGIYECFFAGVDQDSGTDLTLRYETEVVLPKEAVNALAHFAYPIGYTAFEDLRAYRTAHAEYLASVQAYEDYLTASAAYKTDLAAYRAYVAKKAAYDAASEKYAEYLEKKAAYDEAYAAYTAYTEAYNDYLAAYEVFTKTLSELLADRMTVEAYLAYTAAMATCTARLAPMDYIMDPVGYLYNTLMGDTVATVVNNKSLLVAAGCNATDIDTCANATKTLRTLLPLYNACETDEERYAFYRENHTELLDAFTRLQKALYGLFGNSLVQAELDNKDRLERFVQFVGQLYIARCLLDDTLTMSEDWTISVILAHKKRAYTLEEALNGITAVPQDGNAYDPKALSWPTAPDLALPENTEMPTEPTEPTAVERPTEPERVAHPGEEPTEVREPTEPTEVSPPGEEPICTVTDPYLLALADAIERGELQERDELPAYTFTRRTLLHKYIAYNGLPVVTFYDYDGKTVLGRSEPAEDGSVTYRGPKPIRPPTKQYEYLFNGWVDCYGKPVSLANVETDMAVYASYKTDALHYTVTWTVDGRTYTSRHIYGEVPVCPADTQKKSTPLYDYQFAGWNTPILPVTGDASYTATYTEKLRNYRVTFVMKDGQDECTCPAGEVPTPPTPTPYLLENGYILTFTGWSEEIAPILTNKVYTALYSRAMLVQDRTSGNVATVTVSEGLYTVTATRDMNISRLLMLASREGAAIRFTAEGLVLHLPSAVVKELYAASATYLKLRSLNPNAAGVVARASVNFTDATGKSLAKLPDGVSLRFAYPAEKSECGEIYAEQDGENILCPTSSLDGYLSASVQNGTYALTERFTVRIEKAKNGALGADRFKATVGEKITLTVLPASGFRLLTLSVVRTDTGEKIPITDGIFVMPNAPVTVSAVFEEIFYTVRFESEGVTVLELLLRPGEMLTLPSNPTHSDSDRFIFAGWSPAPSAVCTGDAVYTALFTEREANNDDYTSENDNNLLFTTYLPIGGGIFLGVAALVVILIIFKKIKKRRVS